MNLIAIIPSGQTEITVNGLHQWDYGQTLEIHSNDLPAVIEVHFACSGMTEAVVRSCAAKNGVAIASIPDRCIEQTTPIVAWVYRIDGTSARTVATIKLPIMARTKPAPGASVPTEITDKYTELVSAINEQVEALKEGNVTVANALEAGHATSADQATNATNATKASGVIASLHTSCEIKEGYATPPANLSVIDMYLVVFKSVSGFGSGIFCRSEAIDGTYSTSMGDYTLVLLDSGASNGDRIMISSPGKESTEINGTLKFYKIGGISG